MRGLGSAGRAKNAKIAATGGGEELARGVDPCPGRVGDGDGLGASGLPAVANVTSAFEPVPGPLRDTRQQAARWMLACALADPRLEQPTVERADDLGRVSICVALAGP